MRQDVYWGKATMETYLKEGSQNQGRFAHTERLVVNYHRGTFCEHMGPLLWKIQKHVQFRAFYVALENHFHAMSWK